MQISWALYNFFLKKKKQLWVISHHFWDICWEWTTAAPFLWAKETTHRCSCEAQHWSQLHYPSRVSLFLWFFNFFFANQIQFGFKGSLLMTTEATAWHKLAGQYVRFRHTSFNKDTLFFLFIHSLIPSFNKHLLSTQYISSTALGAGVSTVDKIGHHPGPWAQAYILVGRYRK